MERLIELNFVPFETAMMEPEKSMAWVGAVGMYDWSVAARKMLLIDFLLTNVLGTVILIFNLYYLISIYVVTNYLVFLNSNFTK